jgi:hypothetical protein
VNLAVFRPSQEKSNSNPVGTSLCHAPRTVAQCSSPRATTQKSVGERAISDKLLGPLSIGANRRCPFPGAAILETRFGLLASFKPIRHNGRNGQHNRTKQIDQLDRPLL